MGTAMQCNEPGATMRSGLISGHRGIGAGARLTPRAQPAVLSGPLVDFRPPGLLNIRDAGDDLLGRRSHLVLEGGTSFLRKFHTWKERRAFWSQSLRRLVGLSRLGWAFVCASVLWSLFAVAFSLSAESGSNKGTPFFALAVGVLVFGSFLKKDTEHRALSAAFLGVNAVVLSVLSFVVATR